MEKESRTRAYKEATLKDGSVVYRASAPFDDALEVLRDKGIEIPISMQRLAQARMQLPKNHSLNNYGSYTTHGFLHTKNAPPLVARVSPLVTGITLAREAIGANYNGRYFSTDRGLYEEHLAIAEEDAKDKEPIDRRVLILPSMESFSISPRDHPEVFHGLLGDIGENYLKHVGLGALMVYPVDIDTVDSQDGTLLTQLWFHSIGDGSYVLGGVRSLGCDYRVCGVLEKTGEATTRSGR